MTLGPFNTFVFKGYHFDPSTKILKLDYSFDNKLDFTERYTFDFPFVPYDPHVLDRALQGLFFMAGVSYYKAFAVENIRIDQGQLDPAATKFFAHVYQKGLGEYFYINKLDPQTEIPFIPNAPTQNSVQHTSDGGVLIGIGGGKDSLVSVELLRSLPNITTWSLGHRAQLEPLIETIELPHLWVERHIDPQIIGLKDRGALNGHIPISAIFGFVGTIVAILSGKRDVAVSNESSSNEPTLHYDRVAINHQYSKSLDYETSYQAYLARNFGDSLRYYSTLRPYTEVHIAEIFASVGFEKYQHVFSSCNRAFVQSSNKMSWCGVCAKCAFTFLVLSPFVDRKVLEKIWHKNLLLDPTLVITYQNLLGISGNKPLDCVGEVKESRAAMQLAQEIYPGLAYEFDIPDGYDYKALAPHSMPDDILKLISNGRR